MNNKKSTTNNFIENYKNINQRLNNDKDNFNKNDDNIKIERLRRNNKLDISDKNFMSKVNQINYIPESRNMNNNSNNIINVFDSINGKKEIFQKGKKVDYENIRNKQVNISYEQENLRNKGKKNDVSDINKENNQSNKNILGVTRLRMMDPIGMYLLNYKTFFLKLEKLKLLNELNAKNEIRKNSPVNSIYDKRNNETELKLIKKHNTAI